MTTNDMSFAGKVAVVTGSTQGLGEAIVRQMAAKGASGIVVVGRNERRGEAVASSLNCDAHVVATDLADPAAPAFVIGETDRVFGRLDVLVNAAALTSRGSVWDADAELWEQMLNINARAPALLITEAVSLMIRDDIHGSIVNIGSGAANGGQEYLYPYAASKAALQAITKNAAYALMRRRIRVNLIQPGWMNTPGEDSVQREFHNADDHWLENAESAMPFGRLIDPEEIARTICFVASDEAGLMTGAVIDFDQSVTGAGDAPVPPPTIAGPENGPSQTAE